MGFLHFKRDTAKPTKNLRKLINLNKKLLREKMRMNESEEVVEKKEENIILFLDKSCHVQSWMTRQMTNK